MSFPLPTVINPKADCCVILEGVPILYVNRPPPADRDEKRGMSLIAIKSQFPPPTPCPLKQPLCAINRRSLNANMPILENPLSFKGEGIIRNRGEVKKSCKSLP